MIAKYCKNNNHNTEKSYNLKNYSNGIKMSDRISKIIGWCSR